MEKELLFTELAGALIRLGASRFQREAVEKTMSELKAKHGDAEIELLWEKGACGVSYQALFKPEGVEGRFSLEYVPPKHVPWALRHAINPKEMDFLVVETTTMTVMDVMQILDRYYSSEDIPSLILRSGIGQHIQKNLPEDVALACIPTDEEVEKAFDRWRIAKGLFLKSEYEEWLEQVGMSHEVVEHNLRVELRNEKIILSQVEESPESFFERHRDRYTVLHAGVARSENRRTVSELLETVEGANCSLFDAVRELSGHDVEFNMVKWRLSNLRAELKQAVEENPKARIHGPFTKGDGWMLVEVLNVKQPTLDAETRELVVRDMWRDWLNEKRKELKIQWLWGDVETFRNSNVPPFPPPSENAG